MAQTSSTFSKDLNYLWPFFDRLSAHRPEDPAFKAAVAEARLACERVVALLDGDSATDTDLTTAPGEATSTTQDAAEELVVRGGWTVGPLTRAGGRNEHE